MFFADGEAVEGRVQDRWRVARERGTDARAGESASGADSGRVDAEWCRAAVCPAELRMMAGRAGHILRRGKDGIEKQQAPELDLRRRVARQRGGAGQGIESGVRQRFIDWTRLPDLWRAHSRPRFTSRNDDSALPKQRIRRHERKRQRIAFRPCFRLQIKNLTFARKARVGRFGLKIDQGAVIAAEDENLPVDHWRGIRRGDGHARQIGLFSPSGGRGVAPGILQPVAHRFSIRTGVQSRSAEKPHAALRRCHAGQNARTAGAGWQHLPLRTFGFQIERPKGVHRASRGRCFDATGDVEHVIEHAAAHERAGLRQRWQRRVVIQPKHLREVPRGITTACDEHAALG